MTDVMEYKGYVGSVSYSAEDNVLHGKLEGIRDLVTYEATDVTTLKQSFHEAVDDYLETCATEQREPDVPFKGSFNVRTGSELHKRLAVVASQRNKKLNAVVVEALEFYLAALQRDAVQPATVELSHAPSSCPYIRDVAASRIAWSSLSRWGIEQASERYISVGSGPSLPPAHYTPLWHEDETSNALNEQYCGAS